MTNELEKQFFDTFGIEPKTNREYGYSMVIYNEAGTEEIKFYPQITDRILLELRALTNNKTYEEYKAEGLKKVISIMGNNPYQIQQVQALFKEG